MGLFGRMFGGERGGRPAEAEFARQDNLIRANALMDDLKRDKGIREALAENPQAEGLLQDAMMKGFKEGKDAKMISQEIAVMLPQLVTIEKQAPETAPPPPNLDASSGIDIPVIKGEPMAPPPEQRDDHAA